MSFPFTIDKTFTKDISPNEIDNNLIKTYLVLVKDELRNVGYKDILILDNEVRFKRTSIQMQYAMMAQAQQEAEQEIEQEELENNNEEQPVPTQGKRKLRKQ